MADLGFLLLIFFIVTTVFAIEQGIPLVLPGRAAAITRLKPSEILEIRAHANGSVEAGGVRVRRARRRPATAGTPRVSRCACPTGHS